ncbi:MAG TPA: replication-relaxation family protein [Rhizomicrobium sp.]|jgi:hypothetical protein|nr:replication-relaxation family protein [Rhizomicrobium sp.]
MGEFRPSRPRFRRTAGAARIELTPDDIGIIQTVYRHRFVPADCLYRLFPRRSSDRLSRRLTLLFRNEFLDRPVAQIDRFGEGGSRPLVYGLGNAGARFLKERLGTPLGRTDWRSRNKTYTRESLDHTLAVSRHLIDLELACRAHAQAELIPFDEILANAPENTQRMANPSSWSISVQWHGTRSTILIAPDAIFGLRMKDGAGESRVAYFFLEIDRGTMTITPSERVRESDAFPYRATILRKLYAYADSHRQGLHKSHLGIPSARVLTLTTRASRALVMRHTAETLIVRPMKLPAALFLFGVQSGGQDPLTHELEDAGGGKTRLLPNTG